MSFLPSMCKRSSRFPNTLYTRDHAEEAHATASQALELASLLHDATNIVRALSIRGVSALMLGRMREAVEDPRRAHI
jgi:hypothetical protein